MSLTEVTTDTNAAERNLCADSTANHAVQASRKPSPAAARKATKQPKGGAPVENRNAYRHGLYSPRGPEGTIYTDRAANKFRRHLEDCVVAAHGEISVLHAALIHSAAEAARVALAEFTELRELQKDDKIDPMQRTAKRQAALKALDLRDRKVKELGITFTPNAAPTPTDPWAEFDEERRLTLPGTDPALNAPEKPGRFSGPETASESSGTAGTPQRASEKRTEAFPPDASPTIDQSPRKFCQ